MLASEVAPSALDTIAAPATAPGAAAIAIVRLSGPEAFAIGTALCGRPLPPPYKLARRQLRDEQHAPLDDAMVACMPGPASYTGENLLELHLHGGPAVVQAVLAAALRRGARAAGPGEFTRRAVLHGRLSLPAAEGIGQLVQADSELARQGALALVQGGLEGQLAGAYEQLEGLVAGLRATLDFPDDVSAAWPPAELPEALTGLRTTLGAAWRAGRRLPDGEAQVTLLGPPNAGKSTLLNALLGEERALVDAAAGTTRDVLEARWRWQGARLTLCDTAGQRAAADGLEARGMALGLARAEQSSLRLWLLGAPACWPSEAVAACRPLWVIGSRADEVPAAERARLAAEAARRGLEWAGWLSVPAGEGLAALRAALAAFVTEREAQQADRGTLTLCATARQGAGLQAAEAALGRAEAALAAGEPADCLLSPLEDALAALAEVLGREASSALLDRVFADFCIGK